MSDEEVRAILRAVTPNLGFYVGATVLAVALPTIAAFGYLAIAIQLVLRARGDEESRAAAGTT